MARTRIKICGFTREQDVREALLAGADALGFVFYPLSPRYLTLDRAAVLADLVPPFVTRVGLFVNAAPEVVRATLQAVPLELLQFHGDEDESYCQQFGLPYIKAARVRPGLDLVEFALGFPSARALLLDAFVEGYGGGGHVFDWSLIPETLPLPLILSGGLQIANVAEAVRCLRPWAVDVSSGVEVSKELKGIKDAGKMHAFVAQVAAADAHVSA